MATQTMAGNSSVRIVVIDDDLAFLDFVRDALGETGLEIVTSSNPEEGLELILSARTDLVLLDLNLPGQTRFEVLEKIVKANPTTNVILLTAEYSTDSAVEAIQRGAADFLNKPISVNALRARVSKFVETARERRGAMQVSHELKEVFQFEGIVGWSPLMLEVFDRIRRVASHFRNILICGETGTGKEMVARSLHHLSPFSSGPFIVCNCAAMVETLFESELFGHVKGAFTGALQDKKGYFELANKGTLFLDEIGDATPSTQVKLLRVLQDHAVQRVGSPVLHSVDVRVVAATNCDLRAMVAAKKFREDLYYRISTVEIKLPRLSQRREDLPLLQRHFLERYAAQYQKPLRGISRKAQILLTRHFWPGNVRELENVIAHACMMAQGNVIEVGDLPEALHNEQSESAEWDSELCSLEEIQRRHIQRVLRHAKDNKAQAAQILGISRTTLYSFLAKQTGEPKSESETNETNSEVEA